MARCNYRQESQGQGRPYCENVTFEHRLKEDLRELAM